MAPKLNVSLNKPLNNEFYVSNEPIIGSVELELSKPASVISLSIALRGTSQTYVQMSNSDYLTSGAFGTRSSHTLVHQIQTLFPPENIREATNGSKKGFQLSKGRYSYAFEFLMPNWLKCVGDHGRESSGFNRTLSDPRLPPSFNSDVIGEGMVDCENTYYKTGSVTYYMKAVLVLGKMGFRLTPGNTIVEEYRALEFMPSPHNDSDHPLIAHSDAGPLQKFLSKKHFKVGSKRTAKIEVKSPSLTRVFRLDYLFQPGCNKFDQISLMVNRKPTEKLDIKLLHLKLNLIEIVNYLSQGQVNAMIGTIPLIEMNLNLKLETCRVRNTGDGSVEWPLDVAQIPELVLYRFNESDMLYRGNRLFSFTSCNIKRAFKFCLGLTLDINGLLFETEVLTTICDIGYFSLEDHEELPTYEVSDFPPFYSDQNEVVV
ncbi:LAFA_0G12200g1_1 [Lachancea sp. 'fantastica']|nr:LAFA_0G12200g1_1 [Lachancea sp. 'fantastica']